MEGVSNILIVDDDPNVHETLRPWLEREGYLVQSAFNGDDGLRQAEARAPSVVVLDVMMPGIDGMSVCLELNRRHPSVPILMLSARDDLMDRIVGLESGADDYVTKPYHPREVVSRIKALLRRMRRLASSVAQKEEVLQHGALKIEPDSYRAFVGDHPLPLTTTEFELLMALMERPETVHSRQSLLDRVWGTDFFGSERTVDSHIRNLRKKIDDLSPGCDPVESVRGVGYRFKN